MNAVDLTPPRAAAITIGAGVNSPPGQLVPLRTDVGLPDALAEALRSIPSRKEAWWSGGVFQDDYRHGSKWVGSQVNVVDADYCDDDGEHAIVPADLAAAVLDDAREGITPGSVFHATPRGIRVAFVLDRFTMDGDGWKQAALGAAELVRAWLERSKFLSTTFFERVEEGRTRRFPNNGFIIDTGASKDKARLLYTPTSIVGGHQRSCQVLVLRDEPYSVTELSASAPTRTRPPQPDVPKTSLSLVKADRRSKYAEAALAGEEANVAGATPGDRHEALFKAAAKLGQILDLDDRTIHDHLAAAARGVMGDGRDREIERTIRDGIAAGRKTPRQELPDRPLQSHRGRASEELPPDGADDAPPRDESDAPAAGGEDLPLLIKLGLDETRVINEAIAALGTHEAAFQRAGMLVHVVSDALPSECIIRQAGAPRIVRIQRARLRELLASRATWLRWDDKEGDWIPVSPPDRVVAGVEARDEWRGIRPLQAVVSTPVLRPDGTVLDRQGYDEATGLLYRATVEVPAIPARPTSTQVAAAVAALLDVVVDFPFSTDAHRAAWLSSVLTLFGRHAFAGPSPLNLIDANIRGAGKSLLADVTGGIALGAPMARMAPLDDESEERKRITSIVMAGDTVVLIDNVNGELGTPALDAALTSTTWSDRILGRSEASTWPLLTTWFSTGNNVTLRGDTTRRALHIRLESPEEQPERRQGFRHPHLLAHVAKERPRLIHSALTILRGYCAAGRPDMGLPSWGSFEGWSSLIRQAIVWAGEPDPGETREELRRESDHDANALEDLLTGWDAVASEYGGQCTVVQALSELDGAMNAHRHAQLRNALAELCPTPPGKLPNARSVGKTLARFRGRVSGGRALVKAKESKNGIAWSVRRTESVGR